MSKRKNTEIVELEVTEHNNDPYALAALDNYDANAIDDDGEALVSKAVAEELCSRAMKGMEDAMVNIYLLRRTRAWRVLGYDSFKEFCDERFTMSHSRLKELAQAGSVCLRLRNENGRNHVRPILENQALTTQHLLALSRVDADCQLKILMDAWEKSQAANTRMTAADIAKAWEEHNAKAGHILPGTQSTVSFRERVLDIELEEERNKWIIYARERAAEDGLEKPDDTHWAMAWNAYLKSIEPPKPQKETVIDFYLSVVCNNFADVQKQNDPHQRKPFWDEVFKSFNEHCPYFKIERV